MSAILIKPLHSSLVYVVGVKCMERKGEEKEEEDGFRMGKYEFWLFFLFCLKSISELYFINKFKN